MVCYTKGAISCAPLYIHKVRFFQPHLLLESEKFNIKYPNPLHLETTSDRLRYYRYKKALRQQDVADYAGICRSSYNKYEGYKHEYYDILILSKIAEILDVSIGDLLDEYNTFLYNGQGKQIKMIRDSLGMNQVQFAKLLKVYPSTVRKWEENFCIIKKKTWVKLIRIKLDPSNLEIFNRCKQFYFFIL